MDEIYSIRLLDQIESQCICHTQTANKLGVMGQKRGFVSFGCKRKYITMVISDEMAPNEIFLSRDIVQDIKLPLDLCYEVQRRNHEIMIGPFIGILMEYESRRMTEKFLQRALIFAREYEKLHGALIIFALDQVNTKDHTIEGYCYKPHEKQWEKGIFPYPSAIYRQIYRGMEDLTPQWKNHFLSVIGDRLFNNYVFYKWEMHEWFYKDDRTKMYVPDTVIYHGQDNMMRMLEKYPSLYVKPIEGTFGVGVVQITKEKQSIVFRYRKKGRNRRLVYTDKNSIERVCTKLFSPTQYIIQQGIDLLTYEDRIVDFRIVVQKDTGAHWKCKGIFARMGASESVVSNSTNGGKCMEITEFFTKRISLSKERIQFWKGKMGMIGETIGQMLDEFGIHCETIGVDLGMDHQGNLWIIEINNHSPRPEIALVSGKRQLYYEIKASPLFYAKSMIGF